MAEKFFTIPLYRLILYVVFFVIVLFVLYIIADDVESGRHFNQQSIETFIAQSGVFAYLVYTLLVTLLTLTPIASSSLWLIAGYLFNPYVAIGLTVVAELLGGIANFYIGRYLIGGYLSRGKFPKLATTVYRYTEKLNFSIIFALGLMPVSTTNVTAYAAGLSKMRLLQYLVPWVLGVSILAAFTIFLGHSASLHAPLMALVLVIVAAVLYIGFRMYKLFILD